MQLSDLSRIGPQLQPPAHRHGWLMVCSYLSYIIADCLMPRTLVTATSTVVTRTTSLVQSMVLSPSVSSCLMETSTSKPSTTSTGHQLSAQRTSTVLHPNNSPRPAACQSLPSPAHRSDPVSHTLSEPDDDDVLDVLPFLRCIYTCQMSAWRSFTSFFTFDHHLSAICL